MSKKNEEINKFINQCKTRLPEFNKIRERNNITDIKNQEINKYISLFLEEYVKFSTKLNINQLDKNFVNFFQNKILVQKFPDYSKDKIITIQSIIYNFLNFLTLKKVLKQNLTKDISLETQMNPELEKDANVKLTSQINQILNVVSSTIFNFSKIADVENLDNNIIDKFLKDIETYPEKIIIKAIFKLFEEIEDDKIFIKVLFVIDNFLKLNTLPSKTIEYLRFNVEKEKTIYRLLLLYQSFYFAGYKLEKSVLDILNELNMGAPAVNELFEKSSYYLESLGEVNLSHQPFQNSYELFNIEIIIDKIKPLNDKSPIFNPQGTIGYNLPRNINLKIDKHIHQLKKIFNATELKKEFLSAFSEEFSINLLIKDKIFLFFEARELHLKGKNKKALVLIKILLKKNPNLAPALILKGEILCELHQFNYAIKCYSKSLEINPYNFYGYSQLSYTLQIGGYFYSSYLLCSHLIKFCPLDFNLYVQLAFSAYQISRPFKLYLKIAGLLEPERLANFLNRFWIREKIEAKDSEDTLNIKKETISELERLIIYNSKNILQFLTYYNDLLKEDDFNEEFNELINDPLYFFPKKVDHTKKNHFIYELTTDIATRMVEIIVELEPEAERYFLNKQFLQFCFKITLEITDNILEKNLKYNKAKKSISLDLVISKKWLEDAIKNSTKEPYYILIKTLMPLRDFHETIQMSINDLARDCLKCPIKCLIYACEVFPNFEESCNDWENFNEKLCEKEIAQKRARFEKDFLPILSFFEDWLNVKGLSEKTIEEKLSVSLEFFKFVFFNLDIQINDLKNKVRNQVLKLFLEKHILNNKLIQSKTAMARVQRGLNTFLSYLSKELNYFSVERLKSLKETIKKAKFLN
ncbi:MAG: hypothetical protein ACTSRI_16330 [Promethearchaeota archaeon]